MTLEASIADAQQELVKSAERNPDSLTDFFSKLDPSTQRALRNTVIGSLLGGAAGMGAGVMSPEKSVAGSGVMGGLLGGVAGGAGTLGYDMLRSQLRMPGETGSSGSLTDRYVIDPIAGTALNNPVTTAGGVAGGLFAGYRMPTWGKATQAAGELDKLRGHKGGTLGPVARELETAHSIPALKERLWELHKVLKTRGLYGKTIKHPVNLLALPAGLATGYMVDRYIKGQNR